MQRANSLRRKYWPNLTNDQATTEYNKLLEQQNNCCAICSKNQDSLDHTLHVDHCKKTGVVRGLLCMHCNRVFVQDKTAEQVEILKAYFDKFHKAA